MTVHLSDDPDDYHHSRPTLINEESEHERGGDPVNSSNDFSNEDTVMEGASDLAYFLYGQLKKQQMKEITESVDNKGRFDF